MAKQVDRSETYRRLFKELDKDGNGYLDILELRDLLKRGGSKMSDSQIFKYFVFFDGPKGDKKISCEEFEKGLAMIENMEDLTASFMKWDTDKSGLLDRDELKFVLQRTNKGQYKNDAKINTVLKKTDVSGDNKISFDEFLKAVQ